MKHIIEYNGVRKTVEAKRTATVNEVLELAFPGVWAFDYSKVVCIGASASERVLARQVAAYDARPMFPAHICGREGLSVSCPICEVIADQKAPE